ncbi:MAG: peptide chain release factor N(5)-glutamine methyltransferase [Thermodesulfobacteriota bacterium]
MQERPHTRARWTIRDILAWTVDYFAGKGIKTPRLDAEVLLAFSLGVDRLYLYLNLERPLTPLERGRFRELVSRRARREPVALITGTKEFWSIQFRVEPGMLIPRPDTETLVEAILREIKEIQEPHVLELGTGSGAVAAALARERPEARIIATDVDVKTLRVAALNVKSAKVQDSVLCVACDLFSALKPMPRFHVVCSNPPYIPTGTIPTLDPEITLHEPMRALDGGPDGLDVVREIARAARAYLLDGGVLLLEIGDGQKSDAEAILTGDGFRDVRSILDLAGKARVVRGKKCAS